MPEHLILRLEAPLVAFGDVMVDAIGPIRDTPSASTLTGLLCNAIGVMRWERERLSRMQERLVFGCRLDRRGTRFTDFQTAALAKGDKGWTTWGREEERKGGTKTYDSPHIRYRDHHADVRVTVAIRLLQPDESPTIRELAEALDEPARPLFLGRKACLPSSRIFQGFCNAPSVHAALLRIPLGDANLKGSTRRGKREVEPILFVLPTDEARPDGFRDVHSCDSRDWHAGVHTGDSVSYHGYVLPDQVVGEACGESK